MVEYHANWLPFRGSASLPSLLKILLALDNRKTEIFNNWDQLILVDKSEHLLYDHPIIFRVQDDETIVVFMMLSTVEALCEAMFRHMGSVLYLYGYSNYN